MKQCVYDNPATMAREVWRDGRLLCHQQFDTLPPFSDPPPFAFLTNPVRPWNKGEIVGDRDAIDGLPKDTK